MDDTGLVHTNAAAPQDTPAPEEPLDNPDDDFAAWLDCAG